MHRWLVGQGFRRRLRMTGHPVDIHADPATDCPTRQSCPTPRHPNPARGPHAPGTDEYTIDVHKDHRSGNAVKHLGTLPRSTAPGRRPIPATTKHGVRGGRHDSTALTTGTADVLTSNGSGRWSRVCTTRSTLFVARVRFSIQTQAALATCDDATIA